MPKDALFSPLPIPTPFPSPTPDPPKPLQPGDSIGSGVSVVRLLAAIRAVETTNCSEGGIRFEPTWMPPGTRVAVQGRIVVGTGGQFSRSAEAQKRYDDWGVWSCASYGAYQLLYHTARELGALGPDEHPITLNDDDTSQKAAEALVHRIARMGATSVREFADGWNSGNPKDSIVPTHYMDEVEAAYKALG